MRFLFLSKSQADPATRYRAEPIIKVLRARGDQVICDYEPSAFRQMLILLEAPRYDGVFIQRKLFSSGFVRLLRRRARRIFFDFDDAIFLKSSGAASTTRGKKFASIVKAADCVFAGNSYLQQAAAVYNHCVDLTPTCVEVDRYVAQAETTLVETTLLETKKGASQKTEKDPRPFTLVWIGSRSTSRYLRQHLSALNAIGEAYPDIRLKIIADFSLDAGSLGVDRVNWRAETEISELINADVGIAPMTDDPWTRGKCALKVIQYMAAGLAVISSRVGANEDVVVQDETGFLVSSDEQWVEAVGRLMASATLRNEMGAKGLARARKDFDMLTIANKSVARMDSLCHQGANA